MDPVALIVMALTAGAVSALQDGASTAIKDAYARVRALVVCAHPGDRVGAWH